MPFDAKIPNEVRVAQVIAWLKLPPLERPHLINVYFSNADDAGHHFGPDSPEARDAVQRLDQIVGELEDQIRQLRLPVNLLVVSDHGMVQLKRSAITFQDYVGAADLPAPAKRVSTINLYADSPEQAERWFAALHDNDPRFEVYRRSEVPRHLHYSANPRIGDLVVIFKEPVALFGRTLTASEFNSYFERHPGDHGFDPRLIPQMNGHLLCVWT